MAQANQVVQATSGKIPFRYGSRRRIQRVGFIPFQEGQVAPPLQLPNVGYLAGLFLTWRGQISGIGASLKERAPWDLIRRLRVNLNLGSASIVDVSGYGLNLLHAMNGEPPGNQPYVDHFAVWTIYVPIAANLGENFATGLILLQDPQIRASVEIQWNLLGNVYNGTNLQAAPDSGIEVYYVYWEVPNLERVSQPPLILHRIVEDTMPFSKTGEVTYLVPRQGILLQMLHAVYANDLPARWDKVALRLNRVDTVQEITLEMTGLMCVMNTGYSLIRPPFNVAPIDLFAATGRSGMGDLRDAIDTEAVTTVESILTIPSSVQLGNGNNYINTIRRILQPIQP